AQPIVDAAADALRRVIWEPVAGLVRDQSRIFVVPDSFIAAITFETLPGAKRGSYLVEEKSFVYLPVAAERAPRPRKPVGRGALLVGDVAFGANGHADGSEVAAIRSALGLPLAPLPKSADEVAAVAASLEHATEAPAAIRRLTGDAATET